MQARAYIFCKLSKKQRKKCVEKLLVSNELKKKLLSLMDNKKLLLKEYLKQEIDFSERKIALVDIQGSGK